ncbi:MAG TPA: UDP-N-acetylglucosamine 1-carboxyvinyltransferase, partial [Clostridia bacterium]|nr:UDP-N-acetylglucosamine 1-carboxyvinyltransferase [Clostridia bacterium]
MQRILIRGGRRLSGSVKVSGAKNASLPILAASLLFDGAVVIHEVPRLHDVEVMKDVLTHLGARVSWVGNSTIKVDAGGVGKTEVPEDLMRSMRASNLVLGSLLGRAGRAMISFPGGCNIGLRPMDLHLRGLLQMGARITEVEGYIIAEAPSLTGADIHLDFPSVGATENLMMAAVLAKGTTNICNVAREPEIVDLQNFLNSMGAQISGAGTDIIRIRGVKGLHATEYKVIPDRIEAGTHTIAAAITGSEVTVENVIAGHIDPVIAKLREAGVE